MRAVVHAEDRGLVKHYQDLPSAQGAAIRFRAPRKAAEKVFPGRLPSVHIGEVEARLVDASFSGLSIVASDAKATKLPVGSQQPLRLEIAGQTIFSSNCRVVRGQPDRLGQKLGLALEGALFPEDEIRRRYAMAQLNARLTQNPAENLDLVPAEYRLFCDELLVTLRYYQKVMTSFEQADPTPAEQAEALANAEQTLIAAWPAIAERGNALIDTIALQGRAVKKAVKEYTETVLTPEFLGSPAWAQCYAKPLGYPGDFKVMQYVYDNETLGENLADKLTHRFAMYAGSHLRDRLRLVGDAIVQHTAAYPTKKALNIVDVGCGMAWEMRPLLESGLLPENSKMTFIDQELQVLEALHGSFTQDLTNQRRNDVTVEILQASFIELFDSASAVAHLPPQDIISSLGLIDYLSDKRARSFVKGLYSKLAPGGLLVVTNIRNSTHRLEWALGYIFDWDMYYRTEEQMRAMAVDAPEAAVDVFTDPTGNVYIMTLRRPA
ncbi:MAG: class I SAM-dependent methyltransferase [Holosporales bacterium]